MRNGGNAPWYPLSSLRTCLTSTWARPAKRRIRPHPQKSFGVSMPSREALNRFIAKVEANAHVQAIEEFYAPEASMQENELPPRTGRDALLANERNVLSRVRSMTSK